MRSRFRSLVCLLLVAAGMATLCSCSQTAPRQSVVQRLGRALDLGDDAAALDACEDYLGSIKAPDPDPAQTAVIRFVGACPVL